MAIEGNAMVVAARETGAHSFLHATIDGSSARHSGASFEFGASRATRDAHLAAISAPSATCGGACEACSGLMDECSGPSAACSALLAACGGAFAAHGGLPAGRSGVPAEHGGTCAECGGLRAEHSASSAECSALCADHSGFPAEQSETPAECGGKPAVRHLICQLCPETLKASSGISKTWDSVWEPCEKRGEGDLNPRSLSGTGLAIQRLTGLGHPRSVGAYESIGDKGFRLAYSGDISIPEDCPSSYAKC